MMDEQTKLFYETFPPKILQQIICLVQEGTISRNTGKQLLHSYIDTHKAMIDGLFNGVVLNYNDTLNYFLDRNIR